MAVIEQQDFKITDVVPMGTNSEQLEISFEVPLDDTQGEVRVFEGLELLDGFPIPIAGPEFVDKESESVTVTGRADFSQGSFIVALSTSESIEPDNRIYATFSLQDNAVQRTGSTSIDVTRESFDLISASVLTTTDNPVSLDPKPVLQLNDITDGGRREIDRQEVDLSASTPDQPVNFENHGLLRGDRYSLVLLVDPMDGTRGFAARLIREFTPS